VQASPSDPEKFPVVVVGNKIDVEDGKDSKRVISEKKAKSWCTSKGGLMHFECSAKEDINVDAAFEAVARFAVQNEDAEEDVYLPDTVSIDTRGAAPSSGCC
jgi:Ras-related protein Rab-7A